jgi:hypothetical protein
MLNKNWVVVCILTIGSCMNAAFAECIGPEVMGKCLGTENGIASNSNSNQYQSTSGTGYQYDLNKPSDRMNYGYDTDAQRRDQMSTNPNRTLDRNTNQRGGGINW